MINLPHILRPVITWYVGVDRKGEIIPKSLASSKCDQKWNQTIMQVSDFVSNEDAVRLAYWSARNAGVA